MADLSRRDFLKVGGGAALAALGLGLAQAASASEPKAMPSQVSRTTGRQRQAVASTCQLCPARCGILCFVEDGRVVKIEGNPNHPNSSSKICAKGQAGINLLYNPDRLLNPLKRVGRRGENRWQEVSWNQALEEMASHLADIWDSGHPERLVFQGGTAATELLVPRFLRAFGTPNAFISTPNSDTSKMLALELTWGATMEVPDVAHSKYILNFGSNPYEAHFYHIPLVQRLVQGRLENGARLVTFDVRLSKTAGRSDEWFPLTPGSDGLVALAMANVIMQEGLYDSGFLTRWTNASPDALAEHLGQYTVEEAEKVSGIPAADIRRIAREFASNRPATTIAGTGVSMRQDGLQNERAIALLNAVTGNVDVKGGFCLPRTYSFADLEPVPPPPAARSGLADESKFPFSPNVPFHSVLSLIAEGRQRVGAYISYMFNPAYSNPHNGANSQTLQDERLIPYFVAVDTYMSESAALADLVLPDTTYLERWGVDSQPSFEMVPFVALRQPVVPPLGQARSFENVCLELAHRLGLGGHLGFSTVEEYYRLLLEQIPGLKLAGGLETLRKTGVWFDQSARPDYGAYQHSGFATPSGKFEISSEAVNSHLPTYEPIPANAVIDEDSFYLTGFKWSVQTSATAPAKWLSEIVHDNPAWMNRETARSLGIADGDRLVIRSAAGSVATRVRLTEGIHPRTIAISGQTGHWAMGSFAQARRSESVDPDSRLIWWNGHGNGVHPNAVIPVAPAKLSGAQAWHGIVVKVARA